MTKRLPSVVSTPDACKAHYLERYNRTLRDAARARRDFLYISFSISGCKLYHVLCDWSSLETFISQNSIQSQEFPNKALLTLTCNTLLDHLRNFCGEGIGDLGFASV